MSSSSPNGYGTVTFTLAHRIPSTNSSKTLNQAAGDREMPRTEVIRSKREIDLMPQIRRIVRDAIKDGLIRSEKLQMFDEKVKSLKGNQLEDYLQKLWDEL